MLTRFVSHRPNWIGVLALLVSYFTVSPMVAPLSAQTTVLGELKFKGASKVEKTSGVWIDGQYVGYLGELWGPRRILLCLATTNWLFGRRVIRTSRRNLPWNPRNCCSFPSKCRKTTNDTVAQSDRRAES